MYMKIRNCQAKACFTQIMPAPAQEQAQEFYLVLDCIHTCKGSGSRVVVGHLPLQNLNNGGIAPMNGDNSPNHYAIKQGLYCSHCKPCKAFQCNLNYFDLW